MAGTSQATTRRVGEGAEQARPGHDGSGAGSGAILPEPARARRPGPPAGAYLRGRMLSPVRWMSMAWAAWRPSRMAHTISDWPRRMSPAANTCGSEVR